VETYDEFWLSLGWVMSKWVLLGYDSATVSLRDAITVVTFEEMSSLLFTRLVKA
jgi:hypothetical protein